MAKKKNNSSKKKIALQEELQTEIQTDINESSTVIDSFIRNRAIVSILLFVLAFVVFIPSLGNDFVWDDVSYIEKNAHRLNSSALGAGLIAPELKGRSTAGKYFRPVHHASLIIDNEIWNTSPFGFHLTNIILHSVSTVLLYLLTLLLLKEFRVRGRNSIAFFSSTLFALYPLHVESVSFISARGDILAAIFFFLSISFYILSYRKMFYLFLAGICFLLSFLSKEVAIVLPVMIVVFDLITRRFLKRTNIIKYFFIILVTTFYLVIRSQSYSTFSKIFTDAGSELSLGFLGVSELFLNTYLAYFIKLVFPYNLNPFIETVPNWGVGGLILSVILVIALFVLVYLSIKRKENITAFSILWVIATLLPAAVVAILSLALTKLADRFLYIPSAAICILFGYLIYRISVRFNKRWLSYGITTILAISFLVVSVNGQKMWKNNLSLWEYALSKSPSAIGAKMNYGDALRNSGKPSEALKQYLHVNQNNSILNTKAKLTTTHGIVVSYIDLGDYQQAQKWLDVALTYSERYSSHYYYLMGFISLRKNDPLNAEKYLLKSLEIGKGYKTSYLLGGIYFHTAREQQSIENYKKAEKYLKDSLELNPRFSMASLLLAKTYIALGDKQKARINAENALRYADSQEVVNQAQSILQMK